jgi:aliphatic nitrilase
VLARAKPGNVEELVVADVDPEALLSKRLVHDFAGHYNRPDLFQLSIDRGRPAILRDETAS